MMCLSKWVSASSAIALTAMLASGAAAADKVAGGKVKSVDADNKTFVLTDSADKDFTIKLGDQLVVNRAGKESKSDLKAGDVINVCSDKGTFTWTAHYILVQEGTFKGSKLVRGNVKGYDADKKDLTLTSELKQDSTYPLGKAPVRVNMEDSTMANVKIGDHALLIVNTIADKSTLQSVMIDRAK